MPVELTYTALAGRSMVSRPESAHRYHGHERSTPLYGRQQPEVSLARTVTDWSVLILGVGAVTESAGVGR